MLEFGRTGCECSLTSFQLGDLTSQSQFPRPQNGALWNASLRGCLGETNELINEKGSAQHLTPNGSLINGIVAIIGCGRGCRSCSDYPLEAKSRRAEESKC